ncbi:MAG: tRNA (guanosine(46)-N7)-methyltransferase TrmB [Chthoniobacterales bacterium]|nr:tRNA (guanosine(46)-N7)-methyltransferase TrmB [Chthoniobacterales bacterium]
MQYSSAAAAGKAELIPASYFEPIDPAAIFARLAPLEVDLGCGNGAFLVALAAQFPERNFLGIERLIGRVRSACAKAARANLPNVRVLKVELSYAVKYLLPPTSVAVLHLLFPDPWPKQRHHRRRIVTADFLADLHRVLARDGRLRLATDQADYFETIRQLISTQPFAKVDDNAAERFPLTTFEKHFVAAGAPIYRLVLRKVS